MKRLYSKTKETEVSRFLAKKKNWRRNKEKRNKIGATLEKERGMGKRLNIMNAVLLLDVS